MEQLENAFRQGHDLGRIRGLARTLGISDDTVDNLHGRYSGGNGGYGRGSGNDGSGGFFGGGRDNRGYNDDYSRGGGYGGDYRRGQGHGGGGYRDGGGYSDQQMRRDYDESASPEPRGRRY